MNGKRPRIAALVTEYRRYSHAQNIVDRLMGGYGWETRWHRPEVDVVSLYVDQFPESDLSHERVERHPGLSLYPSVTEALTLGGGSLDVDGVLLIAEHGQYPQNEKQQTLYPRYEFFSEMVELFRASGRSVPVFCDKHLSWNWEWALEMVETSRELGFPFMAGSSLPVCWRIPSIDLPSGAEVEEILVVGVGSIDSYDIHSVEALQCLAERRQGGETGVVSVQATRGDAVWDGLQAGSWEAGGCDPELFEASLSRSHSLQPLDETSRHVYPSPEDLPKLEESPVCYRFEYADGLRGTMLLLSGVLRDITVAARLGDRPDPLSTLFYLGAGHQQQPNFFNPLCHHIERLFATGETPYPIERTLLTTGITNAGINSLWQNGKALDTPYLNLEYHVGPESTFRRS